MSGISSKLSLCLSITLRTVPQIKQKFKKVSLAQACIGKGIKFGNILKGISNFISIISVVTMWTLENFIEKSQSMNNRGYKLKGKTTFSIYRFDNRDRNIIICIFFLITIIGVGHALEQNNILYKPQIIMYRITPIGCFFYFAYAVFCLLPFILQVANEIKFNFASGNKH